MTRPLFSAAFALAILAGFALAPQPALAWADKCRENVDNSIDDEFWIHFHTDGTHLDEEAVKRIDRADSLAKARDVEQICIAGQASKEGDAKANRELARARAAAVGNAFVNRGWRRDQIVVEAKGEAWGFMSEWLTSDAAPDRRVVVTFSY